MTNGRRIRRAIHVAHSLAVSLLLSAGIAHAQSLTLSIRQPLPNQLSLGDLWELDVINTSGTPVSVVFRAHVTDPTAGAVLDAQSGTLELAPGARSLDARRLQPISILQSAPGVSTQLGRLSSFPDGHYTVCVEAIPA